VIGRGAVGSLLGLALLAAACAHEEEDAATGTSAQTASGPVLPAFSADEAPNERDFWPRAQNDEAFARGVRALCIDGGNQPTVGMVAVVPPQDLDFGPDPANPAQNRYFGPWQSEMSYAAQRTVRVRMWGHADTPTVTPRWWFWKWDGSVAARIAAHKRLAQDRAAVRAARANGATAATATAGSATRCACPSAAGVEAKCPLPPGSGYDAECCVESSACWNEWHPSGAAVTTRALLSEAPGTEVVEPVGGEGAPPALDPPPAPAPGVPPTDTVPPEQIYAEEPSPAVPVNEQHSPAEQAHPNGLAGDLPAKDAVSPNWWMYCLADGDEHIVPSGRRFSPGADYEEGSLLVNTAGVWAACRDRGAILASNGDHDTCTTTAGKAGHRVTYGYLQRELVVPDGWDGVRVALRGPSGAVTEMLWAPSRPWPDPNPPLSDEERSPFDKVSLETSSPEMVYDRATKTWAMRVGVTLVNRNATVSVALSALDVTAVNDSARAALAVRKAAFSPAPGATASAVAAGALSTPRVARTAGGAVTEGTLDGRYVSFGVDLAPLRPSPELAADLLAMARASAAASASVAGSSEDGAAITATSTPITPPRALDGSSTFDLSLAAARVAPGATARWAIEYAFPCATGAAANPLGLITAQARIKLDALRGDAVLQTLDETDPLFVEVAGQSLSLACLGHEVFLPIVSR
jgi:hypothetical protein